jgi:hypothetical protein
MKISTAISLTGLLLNICFLYSDAQASCNPSEAQGGYCNLLGKHYDVVRNTSVFITNPQFNGSGTIIRKIGRKYTVITAGHVLTKVSPSEYEDYPLITYDNRKHIITKAQTFQPLDLMEIEFESDEDYQTAPLSNPIVGRYDKVAIAGFPVNNRGNGKTEMCEAYPMGCWNTMKITKKEAQRLGLNPEFYVEKVSEGAGTFRLAIEPTISGKDGSCSIIDYSSILINSNGYNVTYNCMTFPGMSGGGVWRESDGKLIGVHGLGLGLRLKKNGKDVVYKAGLNMGISANQINMSNLSQSSKGEVSSRDLSKEKQHARFLLESGKIDESLAAYKLIEDKAEEPLEKLAIKANILVGLIVSGDLGKASERHAELGQKLNQISASLRLEDNNSISYFMARNSYLLSSQAIAILTRNFSKLKNSTYLLEKDALTMEGTRASSLDYARLNNLSGQILKGEDWSAGTSRTAYSSLIESGGYLDFGNSFNADTTALINLENWLKAIELRKHMAGSDYKKKRICEKLAAATIQTFYSDPLEYYIQQSLKDSVREYCLGSGKDDFIKNEDIIPLFLMFAS